MAANKPGERRGGRQVGAKNKATLERERIAAEIAARTVADARTQNRKLAKEVLDECMVTLMGMAATFQPLPPGVVDPMRTPDEGRFKEYIQLAMYAAKALAPFQSPTFKAVAVAAVNDLTGAAGPQVPAGETADNIIRMNDPVRAARVYAQFIQRRASA